MEIQCWLRGGRGLGPRKDEMRLPKVGVITSSKTLVKLMSADFLCIQPLMPSQPILSADMARRRRRKRCCFLARPVQIAASPSSNSRTRPPICLPFGSFALFRTPAKHLSARNSCSLESVPWCIQRRSGQQPKHSGNTPAKVSQVGRANSATALSWTGA